MSKEQIAMLALGVSLLAAVFSGGQQIGALTATVAEQTKQIDTLMTKVDGLVLDANGTRLEMMRWIGAHLEP
jgi:hypothetical protein